MLRTVGRLGLLRMFGEVREMNCKPGDLAVIVKSLSPDGAEHIGKIVRCVQVVDHDAWATDPVLIFSSGFGPILWFDRHLRPIRDPGPDAVDETLEWLPVLTKEGQPA